LKQKVSFVQSYNKNPIRSLLTYFISLLFLLFIDYSLIYNWFMDFRGKEILITQNSLVNYTGSEIATLELSNYFIECGARVTIFTFSFDKPISEEFANNNINIITDINADITLSQFDLLWIHHQLVPIKILDELAMGHSLPIVVFSHMSSFIPHESPYIYGLEEEISSLKLFNSNETKKLLSKFFNEKSGAILPNPTPKSFINKQDIRPKRNTPEKILVVSNHPTHEVIETIKILNNKGVETNIIGVLDSPRLITPELLINYDAVITIGKTVQYCLVLGIPVYCYDQFGGCGFLNRQNYKKAFEFNFSGRGFDKKTPKSISSELYNGFFEARDYMYANRETAKKQFDIELCLNKVLHNLKPKGLTKIDRAAIESYKAALCIEQELVLLRKADKLARDLSKILISKDEQLLNYKEEIKQLEYIHNKKIVKVSILASGLIRKITDLLKSKT